jgi:6-phosphogluconolactonase
MKTIPFSFFFLSVVVSVVLLAAAAPQGVGQTSAGEVLMYAGTYTRQESKGIYGYRFQPATGELTPIGLVAETVSPSWVTIHPNKRFLYAANESEGTLSAFSLDSKTGRLTFLNRVDAGGRSPCHLVLEKTGKYLMVANYGNGSVASFPVKEDGSLGETSALVQHNGKSVGRRQQGPHAHAVVLSPDHRFLFVPDLGLDQVLAYRVDAQSGALAPAAPPFTKITEGSGPRHMAFHPNGRFAYVNSEMGSLVTALRYDPASGALKELQTTSTLPKDFTGTNNTAEAEVHPNGRFLYVSNRGHDTIAVFAIDASNGMLTFVEHAPTQGKTPRNFAIDPTGSYLFAANQDTDNIVLFRIDQSTGRLTPTGKVLEIDAPVSLVFLRTQ